MERVTCLVVAAADVPAGDDWLAPEERDALAALRNADRRAEWRIGRWCAKRLLARSLPHAPPLAGIEVRTAHDGAPEAFVLGEPAPYALSIGHRAELALCAVAAPRAMLGCDLALVAPRPAEFVDERFTAAERAHMAEVPPRAHPALANLVWSAKESALKALRLGLDVDSHDVDVRLVDGVVDGWVPIVVQRGGRVLSGWSRWLGAHVVTVVAGPDRGPPVLLGWPASRPAVDEEAVPVSVTALSGRSGAWRPRMLAEAVAR